MKPKSIQRSSLSEQLCEILIESIKSGKFQDGDKLPSEKELTEIYSVSRLTVRAAIQRLNALGLVITKAGEGTFIKAFDREKYLQEVSSKIVEPKMLDDISDFRRLIDTECIRLAIQNASDEELLRLRGACENFDNLSKSDFEMPEEHFRALAESDYKIHLIICELSKNSLYSLAYMAAQEAIKLYLYTILTSRNKRYKELRNLTDTDLSSMGHLNLYEAIKSRDFEKAKRMILNHIDYMVLALPPEEFKNKSGQSKKLLNFNSHC